MPSSTSEIDNSNLQPSSFHVASPEEESSGQTGGLVPSEITAPWNIGTSSSPVDQIFEETFANDCTELEHHCCPICYRTISSTSGSSYSSSVHSCEGSLHRRGQSMRSQVDMAANNLAGNGSSHTNNEQQIVIHRDTETLETLEKKHNPVKQPYHAPRKVGQRLLPSKVTPYGVISGVFPIIKWLPAYNIKGDLIADILAGITVLALQIPQGLAYSKLAGVAPVYGLYATFFSMLIYPLMATSKHVSMGKWVEQKGNRAKVHSQMISTCDILVQQCPSHSVFGPLL